MKVEEQGTEYVYCCPFKGCPDESGHFYVNYAKNKYICFRCDKRGDLLEFLVSRGLDLEEDEFPVSVNWGQEVLARLDKLGDSDSVKHNVQIGPMPEEDIPPTSPLNPECIMYLQHRGFSLEIAKLYGMRCIDKGPYSRVFLPCYMHGELVFWQGRAIHKDMKPKYWQPPESRRSEALFNYDNARDQEYDHVVICEGIFSAIRVGLSAVALFGKSCSPQQLKLLFDMNKSHYYIALDGDAVDNALALMKTFHGRGKRASVIMMPDGHDPDTYSVCDAPILSNEFDVLRYRLSIG